MALGAPAARDLLPRSRRDLLEQAVGAAGAAAEGHMVIAGDRQDIPDSSSLQRSAQLGVGAVDLVPGDPGVGDEVYGIPGFRPGRSRSSRSYSVAVFNASYAAVSTLVMLLALK